MELEDKITTIKGVGKQTQKNFSKLAISTIEDLIEHYPRTYEVYGEICPISGLREGETAVIEAGVLNHPEQKIVGSLKILTCPVKDVSGVISLTWFNMPFLKGILKIGSKMLFRGKAVRKNGILVMEQPQILKKQEYYNLRHVLQPIYPLTGKLTNRAVTKAVGQALKELHWTEDYLPLEIRKQYHLMNRKAAWTEIHFPKDRKNLLDARRRIVFDEFFLFTLALNQLKKQKNEVNSSYKMKVIPECDEIIQSLPYVLTGAQKRVWEEIKEDLTSGFVMRRLVQGDVGSGKTVIAALALYMAVKNGGQGAIMAPTEVLARQHFESLKQLHLFDKISLVLLTGSMTQKEKRLVYEKTASGQADIIVGTHALIQEQVIYHKLSLVITDEQHRFGVKQREALSDKGKHPHFLVMSATPIPRTLAIILYGDLDLSVIDELPANREPIKNCVVNTSYRPAAYRFIEKQILEGRQAYIICPMVEENETIEVENVMEYTQKIKESISPSITIAYLHGKMKAKEKNDIMERFQRGEIQLLVSTTVIEVGVNVPNATVMMIENAERFGLAQLHQLRGRVGRGSHSSYCILVSGKESKETKERLEIMNRSNDGFFIAGEDLKMRGPGDLFGIRQSGMLEFKMADIYQDGDILKEANEAAKKFTLNQIKLLCDKYTNLRKKIGCYAEEIFL